MDMAGFTLLGSLSLALIGIGPEASTVFLFAHPVPGYLPAHQHPHPALGWDTSSSGRRAMRFTTARACTTTNFSDLPVFDLIFGTFRNPAGYEHENGFYHGASARVGDMLVFRDVTVPAPDATVTSGVRG